MSPGLREERGEGKRHLSVALLGPSGAGKTLLASALLARLAPRSAPTLASPYRELVRGAAGGILPREPATFTVVGADLSVETAGRRYTLLDCPGHPDYLGNAINEMAISDAAILVAAVERGAVPEVGEHLLLAHQLGVRSLVVFLSTAGADARRIDQVEEGIRLLLVRREYPGDDVCFIQGNPLNAVAAGAGGSAWKPIDDLVRALEMLPTPERDEEGPLLLPICWVQRRREAAGPIEVRGRVERGSLRAGADVELVAGPRPAPVRVGGWVEFSHRKEIEAGAGEIVRFSLEEGLARQGRLFRGQVVAAPGTLAPATRVVADIRLLPTEEGGRKTPVFSGFQPQVFFRNSALIGTLHLASHPGIFYPGQQQICAVEFAQQHPVVAAEGQPFVLRASSQTIGVGTVIKVLS